MSELNKASALNATGDEVVCKDMSTIPKEAIVCFLFACLLMAWMGRYDFKQVNQFGSIAIIDRWTGEIKLCDAVSEGCRKYRN